MRKVYKYPVPSGGGYFEMMLPKGAQILDVQVQHQLLQMWALVDSNCETIESRNFLFAGTGMPIDHDGTLLHIGTFQTQGGSYIWHIFEVL